MNRCLIAAAVVLLATTAAVPQVIKTNDRDPKEQHCTGMLAEVQPQSAIEYRFTGEDATVFLDAVEPGSNTRGGNFVAVLSGDDVFGGAVAIAGDSKDCLKGRKFLGPIEYLNALALIDRHRAGKPVDVADLQQAAAGGDADAQAHLGIRMHIGQGHAAAGRDFLTEAAEKNVGLATLALGYWKSGLDLAVRLDGPQEEEEPFVDRAAGFCWLRVASSSVDSHIAQLAQLFTQQLEERMSDTERDEGLKRWNQTKHDLAHPSCK